MFSLCLLAAVLAQLQPTTPAAQPAAARTAATPAVSAPPGQAEILETRLPAYTAQVVNISPTGITVKLGNEPRQVVFDQLLRSRFSVPDLKPDASRIAVELSDGSTLNCAKISSDGKNVVLNMADESSVSLPARQVASCLLQPLDVELAKQWEAIVESRISSDTLILKRSATALDKIEGVIGEVSDSSVKFQFDNQTIEVVRTKLAGWRYYAPAAASKAKLLAVVRDHHGSKWMVQSISGDWTKAGATAELQLQCGATISLPTSAISDIDFSFGSMRFLADLEPIERKVQPRLALSASLPEAELLFGPRPSAAESQRGATAGPGVDFMGSGSIAYRVPDEFKRLLGSVALTPDGPHYVPCKAQVLLEDKVIWEKRLTSPQESFPVEIEVESGKRVRLSVQSESQQPVGDLVSWRQLRFVK
jgi:hypothetical protein